MKGLDPLKIPLEGRSLLEASAGTGKTYTITLLALRLLLELGLDISSLLIVTFTKAATAELRAKVRSRVIEAIQGLEQGCFTDQWSGRVVARAVEIRGEAAVRLDLKRAMVSLDQAPIFTIHGFCHRVLQEFPLECDAPLRWELAGTGGGFMRRAVEEFWRRNIYGATEDHARFVLDSFGGPESLLENCIKKVLRPERPEPVGGDSPEIKRQVEFLRKAAQEVARIWREMEAREGVLTYDDLVERVHAGIASAGGGPLAKALARRYRAVLIDEFQDTDPLQYAIFDAMNRAGQGFTPPHFLLLIGDPKQAIYGFRGGDVFTYVKARRSVPLENRFLLPRNWRSSPGLVAAVNRLFSGSQNPFVYEEIGYEEVEPCQPPPLELMDPREKGELVVWLPEPSWPRNKSGTFTVGPGREALARACGLEILRLLAEEVYLVDGAGERRRLKAGDIAVLVRGHGEVQPLRDAFEQLGVKAVYQGQQSVFATPEAQDLLAAARGVLEWGNPGAVKAALATRPLGWTAAMLRRLDQEPREWEEQSAIFEELHDTWVRKGFLPMFRRMTHLFGVPRRLLSGGDGSTEGERSMTNWMQLGELLHRYEDESGCGPEQLLTWFAQQMDEETTDEEERQLRLESDGELVKVMTIHKSKGLEFPVVFIPFTWALQQGKAERLSRFFDKETDRYLLQLKHDKRSRRVFYAYSLAESLRLLYVAVTRAKARCYISWGRFNGFEKSALGHLFGVQKGMDDHGVEEAIIDRFQGLHAVTVTRAPHGEEGYRLPEEERCYLYQVRRPTREVRQVWGVESFSSLAGGVEEAGGLGGEGEAYEVVATNAGGPSIFTFPVGPDAGSCLHAILEEIDFSRPSPSAIEETARRWLSNYGLGEEWAPVASEMVENAIGTEIISGFRLKGLEKGKSLKEMEFIFPFRGDGEGVPEGCAPLLKRKGYLEGGVIRGFIDLLFCHQGRYYVVDYKSNLLGNRLEEYGPERLREAMDQHRYWLQAEIYGTALHRFLEANLPDYDFFTHFGGIIYLFIRGMRPEWGSRYGVLKMDPSWMGERLGRLG